MSDDPDARAPQLSRRHFIGALMTAAALPAAGREGSRRRSAHPMTCDGGPAGAPADAATVSAAAHRFARPIPGIIRSRPPTPGRCVLGLDRGRGHRRAVRSGGGRRRHLRPVGGVFLSQGARPAPARSSLLDNHDDFGGHAKRNEFHHQGRTYLSFGGSMSIETPFPYSHTREEPFGRARRTAHLVPAL